MLVRYLRLVCRSKTIDYPMYLDAAIETTDEGSLIRNKGVVCGFMGALDGNINPFILRRDKANPDSALPYQLDFGSYNNEPYRFYTTNLPTKKIEVGVQFTIEWFDDTEHKLVEVIYELREMIDLINLKSIDSLRV